MPDVSELVSRLSVCANAEGGGPICDALEEAADTIESLQSTVSRLREALRSASIRMNIMSATAITEGKPEVAAKIDLWNAHIDEALKDIQSMKDGS